MCVCLFVVCACVCACAGLTLCVHHNPQLVRGQDQHLTRLKVSKYVMLLADLCTNEFFFFKSSTSLPKHFCITIITFCITVLTFMLSGDTTFYI